MNEKIKSMIQEKLQMIEVLQEHVKILSELVGEEIVFPTHEEKFTSNPNNIVQKINAYRENLMRDIERSLPNIGAINGMPSMGGIGMPGVSGMPSPEDMKKRFEGIKREVENIKKE